MGGRKWALAFQLLGVGWFVTICICGGTAGGYLLDRQFGFGSGLTLTGLFIGIAIAAIGMSGSFHYLKQDIIMVKFLRRDRGDDVERGVRQGS